MVNKFLAFFNLPIDLGKLVASYFSANFILILAQALAGLVVARLIDPTDMGIFLTTTIILTYIPILLLGVNNGLNRNLPYIIGQGKHEEAEIMRNSALSFAMLISIVIFIIVITIGIYFYFRGQIKLALAFGSTAVTAALAPISTMKEVTYRTNSDFIKLSRIKFIKIVLALSTILIVYFYDYYGMLVRGALISIFYLILLFQFSKQNFFYQVNKQAILGLLKTGLPIFIIAYLYTAYIGLDKVFIIKYFGTVAMGTYVPALQVSMALNILPSSIFQIIYPRMATRYGQTNKISSLKKLAFTPQLYLAIGLIPLFGLAAWLVGPFVELVLPKYIEGISLARWTVLVFYFRCLGGPQDVLTVIGDLIPYGVITVVCGIIFFVFFLFLKSIGWGLQAVPASLAFSIFIYNAFISIYVFRLMQKETHNNDK